MVPVKLIDAQTEFAVEAGGKKLFKAPVQLGFVLEPNAIGHDLVEAETEFDRPAAECDQKFGVEKRLAAGEADDLDAELAGVFEESQRHGNR